MKREETAMTEEEKPDVIRSCRQLRRMQDADAHRGPCDDRLQRLLKAAFGRRFFFFQRPISDSKRPISIFFPVPNAYMLYFLNYR